LSKRFAASLVSFLAAGQIINILAKIYQYFSNGFAAPLAHFLEADQIIYILATI
jgi:hypothetical protein